MSNETQNATNSKEKTVSEMINDEISNLFNGQFDINENQINSIQFQTLLDNIGKLQNIIIKKKFLFDVISQKNPDITKYFEKQLNIRYLSEATDDTQLFILQRFYSQLFESSLLIYYDSVKNQMKYYFENFDITNMEKNFRLKILAVKIIICLYMISHITILNLKYIFNSDVSIIAPTINQIIFDNSELIDSISNLYNLNFSQSAN